MVAVIARPLPGVSRKAAYDTSMVRPGVGGADSERQQVGTDHAVEDGGVVEPHTWRGMVIPF